MGVGVWGNDVSERRGWMLGMANRTRNDVVQRSTESRVL